MSAGDYERRMASLRQRSLFTQALLGLFLFVTAVLAGLTLLAAIVEVRQSYSSYLIYEPKLARTIAIVFLPAAVALSLWVWRAHANLHIDSASPPAGSPSSAALGLWVPVLNLYAPKGAMRELWNRSHGEPDWFAHQSVDAVNSWWTCYVAGILILSVLNLMVLIERTTNLFFTAPSGANALAFSIASALLAVASWFLIRIVRTVTLAQQTMVRVGDTFA